MAFLAKNPVPYASLDPRAQLDRRLSTSYATKYAGMSVAPDGSYIIHEKGSSDPALESSALSGFQTLPSEFTKAGAHVPIGVQAHIIFASNASYSLAELTNARDIVAANLGNMPNVWGIGLDTGDDRLFLSSDGSVAAIGQLANLGIAGLTDMVQDHISPTPPHVTSGRLSDSPPWNGGDQIVSPDEGCTTGFGMLNNSTGVVRMMTAGHCGNNYFYNTDFFNPVFNATDLLGVSITSSNPYPTHDSGVDAQLLDLGSKSASCISWGGVSAYGGTLVRIYETGYANPVYGASIKLEGSFGFELSGTVTAVGTTFKETDGNGKTYTVINGFSTSAIGEAGDSGGPIIESSIYGPLATGIITSAAPTYGSGQEINSMIYIYGGAHPITC